MSKEQLASNASKTERATIFPAVYNYQEQLAIYWLHPVHQKCKDCEKKVFENIVDRTVFEEHCAEVCLRRKMSCAASKKNECAAFGFNLVLEIFSDHNVRHTEYVSIVRALSFLISTLSVRIHCMGAVIPNTYPCISDYNVRH